MDDEALARWTHGAVEDERVAKSLAAVRKRAYLVLTRKTHNSVESGMSGLWDMSLVVDCLARRTLAPLDFGFKRKRIELVAPPAAVMAAPDIVALASLHRLDLDLPPEDSKLDLALIAMHYRDYCETLLELSQFVQASVQDGSLVLRHPRTRAPCSKDSGWAARDLDQALAGVRLDADCGEWTAFDDRWPDDACMPPGAVTPVDAEAWAVRAGIAEPGEVLARIGMLDEWIGDEAQTRPADRLSAEQAPRAGLMAQNLERVRAAIQGAGFDPDDLPAVSPGKPCPVKAAARSRAGLSKDVFDHAWKELPKRRTAAP